MKKLLVGVLAAVSLAGCGSAAHKLASEGPPPTTASSDPALDQEIAVLLDDTGKSDFLRCSSYEALGLLRLQNNYGPGIPRDRVTGSEYSSEYRDVQALWEKVPGWEEKYGVELSGKYGIWTIAHACAQRFAPTQDDYVNGRTDNSVPEPPEG